MGSHVTSSLRLPGQLVGPDRLRQWRKHTGSLKFTLLVSVCTAWMRNCSSAAAFCNNQDCHGRAAKKNLGADAGGWKTGDRAVMCRNVP